MEKSKRKNLKKWIAGLDREAMEVLLAECIEELEVSEAISYYPKTEDDAPYWSNSGLRLGEKE